MRRPERIPRGWSAALLGAVVAGACFDPPQIPEPRTFDDVAGSAGLPDTAGGAEGGAGSGEAGQAGPSPAGSGRGGKPASGGMPASAGTAAGRGGSAGAIGGGGGGSGGAAPRITWLTLEADRAPGAAGANASVDIDGRFYAYADACAELHWDASTRCVSGKLCEPGFSYENWGIAVGFDFRTSGPDAMPADAKLLWDPRQVAAKGIAWRFSGTAPGVQLWVLNMDPQFGDACDAMTCEIAGPPDGTRSATLSGELAFASMEKDDWGGQGERYTFDPARVHALQIKLPAVVVGAASFDFCIDALGVLR